MSSRFQEAMNRSNMIVIAAGAAIGLALYLLAAAIVSWWIAPLIAVFVGKHDFATNAFTIQGSEFKYGRFVVDALTVVLILVAAYVLVGAPLRRKGTTTEMRRCPECTSPISIAAKRCPHCTAVVQPDSQVNP